MNSGLGFDCGVYEGCDTPINKTKPRVCYFPITKRHLGSKKKNAQKLEKGKKQYFFNSNAIE